VQNLISWRDLPLSQATPRHDRSSLADSRQIMHCGSLPGNVQLAKTLARKEREEHSLSNKSRCRTLSCDRLAVCLQIRCQRSNDWLVPHNLFGNIEVYSFASKRN